MNAAARVLLALEHQDQIVSMMAALVRFRVGRLDKDGLREAWKRYQDFMMMYEPPGIAGFDEDKLKAAVEKELA